MAGYSGTPLAKKLGIGPGSRVRVGHAPPGYARLVAPLPEGVEISPRLRKDVDVCHFFTNSARELARELPRLKGLILENGCIWISWPKRASGVPSDVTEDTVREVALPLGLVDVKVCAVDATWSGLKLVIRRELRRGARGTGRG